MNLLFVRFPIDHPFAQLTGSNNIIIGIGANVSASGAAFTNASAIGYNTLVGASNSMVLGGTGADAVNIGAGITIPNVKIDIDGAIAVRSSSTTVTADNQAVTVGNRSFIKLTSNGTPANRTVTLSNGLSDGQVLYISVAGTGTNGVEFADSGNLNLTGLTTCNLARHTSETNSSTVNPASRMRVRNVPFANSL